MNVLAFFIVGFLIHDLWMRVTGRKVVTVVVTDKDGTRRLVDVNVCRDKEVDELLKAAKQPQGVFGKLLNQINDDEQMFRDIDEKEANR